MTFEDVDGATRVTLGHVGLRDAQSADRHASSWRSILDKSRAAVEPQESALRP